MTPACVALDGQHIALLGHAAWALLALRAIWLLPDWVAKWQRVLQTQAASRRSGARTPRERRASHHRPDS